MTPTTDSLVPSGSISPLTVDMPAGYVYGVTRYADVILERSFPDQLNQLRHSLSQFRPEYSELLMGGGGRTPFVARFDTSLEKQGWGKRTITIEMLLDNEPISQVRGHEIDMFATRTSPQSPYPGIAVEMEWSNKDPFFDRDLVNFQALHREGALAVGVIITRGPKLQDIIKTVILNSDGKSKYGESSTHWKKLVPRINLGGGGECPLLLIGIEPPRIGNFDAAVKGYEEIVAVNRRLENWRDEFRSRQDAKREFDRVRQDVLDRLKRSSPSSEST